jgi:hypothetical protein
VAAVNLVTYAGFGAVARADLRAAERLASGVAAAVTVTDATYTVVAANNPSTPTGEAHYATFTEAAQHAAANGGGLITDVAEVGVP